MIHTQQDTIKADLYNLIDNIEDNKILTAIYTILHSYNRTKEHTDFWDEILQQLKSKIKKARQEIKDGKVKNHNEVINKYKAWL